MVTPKVFIPQKKVTENGFGDVEMFPFMLGWTKMWCADRKDAMEEAISRTSNIH